MLHVGEMAPSFRAESTHGMIDLRDYLGKQNVIIIFYPGDDTPICTKQLCAMQESYSTLSGMDTAVLGINPAGAEKHQAFANKFGYQFPLIIDEGEAIRKKYHVGKILGFFAQQRVVYIIEKTGKIIYARKGNPPVKELIAVINDRQATD